MKLFYLRDKQRLPAIESSSDKVCGTSPSMDDITSGVIVAERVPSLPGKIRARYDRLTSF